MACVSRSKRKLALQDDTERKRFRRSRSTSTTGSHDSEIQDAAEFSEDSGSEASPTGITTNPSTPSTPRSKYPSELKVHYCDFEDCSRSFNRPARLAEHIRSHKNERLFRCQEADCRKDFLRDSHLSHHIKSAHTSIRDYECKWQGCNKNFLTATRLRRHDAAHQGREKYRCSEYPPCDQTFRKHNTLQKHIVSVHLQQKPFPCTGVDPLTKLPCTGAFDTAGRLKAHENRIHGDIRFWCTDCKSELMEDEEDGAVGFASYAEFQHHIKTVHPPQCLDCGYVCVSQRELKQHLEVAHGTIDLARRQIHVCEVDGCAKEFTKKYNLTLHNRTVHEKQKGFICGGYDLSALKGVDGWSNENGCLSAFTSRQSLENHIRSQHLGISRQQKRQKQKEERSKLDQSWNTSGLPSTISALTGLGYGDATGRTIPCVVDGCQHRLIRTYDLKVHLRSFHSLREETTQQALERQDAFDDDTWNLERPPGDIRFNTDYAEEEQLPNHQLAADLGLEFRDDF